MSLLKFDAFVVSIKDATTGIEIARSLYPVDCRCSERAKIMAIESAKRFTLNYRAKEKWCKQYGISVSQYEALLSDNRIDPLKDYTFDAEYTNGLNSKAL